MNDESAENNRAVPLLSNINMDTTSDVTTLINWVPVRKDIFSGERKHSSFSLLLKK